MGLLDWTGIFKRARPGRPTLNERLRSSIRVGDRELALRLLEQGASAPDMLNEAMVAKHYCVALALVERGAEFNQESVRILALASNEENNRHQEAHYEQSFAYILTNTPAPPPSILPTDLRTLIWCCMETKGLDWLVVYSLGAAAYNRHHSFDRAAADRLINNACPQFQESLNLVWLSHGHIPQRPPPRLHTQQDKDRLLAEIFDRCGEVLDSTEREHGIDYLLSQGANPNTMSKHPILDQPATLMARATQAGDKQMLQKFLTAGGTIDPLGLDGLVHASMQMFDLNTMGDFQCVYLMDIINIIEQYSTIDWDRTIPRPVSFYERLISECFGGRGVEFHDHVSVLSLLAKHIPEMEALLQRRQLGATTPHMDGGLIRRL
jgi:hypothetical protein